MPDGPTALFDKSTVQMLSVEEARWFLHFFRGVLTPVFLAEVLGNLVKPFADGRDPARMVSSLAAKTDALGTLPNVSHYDLIRANLLGYDVEMSCRPIVGGAQQLLAEDGSRGWFLDQTPEERVLQKWRSGHFEEAEFERARSWRTYAASFDYDPLIDILSTVPSEISSDIAKLGLVDFKAAAIGTFSSETYAWNRLKVALQTFGIVGNLRGEIVRRWDFMGRPALPTFAPYVFFLMCLIQTSMFGIGRKIISSRPTNAIDEQYLFYLPFAHVFVSNDTMHRQLAPHFMDGSQIFVWASDLKSGLKMMVAYYHEHQDELRTQGSMRFAEFPPLGFETVIHEVYDHLRPGWRACALQGPKPPITKEQSDKIMKHLKPMRDAINRLKIRDTDPTP